MYSVSIAGGYVTSRGLGRNLSWNCTLGYCAATHSIADAGFPSDEAGRALAGPNGIGETLFKKHGRTLPRFRPSAAAHRSLNLKTGMERGQDAQAADVQ